VQGFADFFDGVLGGAILVALAVALAGPAYALLVVPPDVGPYTDRMRARAARLLAIAAVVLAVLQIVVLGLKQMVLAADLGTIAFDRFPETLQYRAGVARAACAAVLAVAGGWAFVRPRARAAWAAVIVVATATAVVGAWLAHAAGRVDGRATLMALTVLHQVAASLWVGGLVHVGATWRFGREDGVIAALWPRVLVRFSNLALPCVVALVALALPLTYRNVESWNGLVGTGYGSLVVTKVGLLAAALVLAACSHVAVRAYRLRRERGRVDVRVPFLLQAETMLAIVLLFTAASLSSQPPARDVADQATVAEVAEVFRPKLPALRTPSVATMAQTSTATDPYAAVGGERTYASYSWSNFSHNAAGVLLLAMSVGALAANLGWRFARNWPAGLVALGVFVVLRSLAVDGIWPFGARDFWASTLGSAEDLQHRLAGLLAIALGAVEWRARRAGSASRLAYVFPVLATAGGLLLLVHAHVAFEQKSSFLVQITHSTMGALAVLLACGRLLELRLTPPLGRVAGIGSTLAMLLIALVLLFYREANVVIPREAEAAITAPRDVGAGEDDAALENVR
jgi:putative copper resistance protein D